MKIIIETPQLIMREFEESDAENLFRLDSDPRVLKYLRMKPLTKLEESERDVSYIRQQYKDNGLGRLAVIEKKSMSFVGWSGLKYVNDATVNEKTNYYDLGYRLIPEFWRKGYGYESALAALKFGFDELNLEKICGCASLDNIGSRKILSKVGLKEKNEFMYEDIPCMWYEKENVK